MQKKIGIAIVLLLLMGLTAHLAGGPGGPGFAQTLRTAVHGK